MNNFLLKPLTNLFNLIHSGVTSLIGTGNLSLAYFFDIFIFTALIKLILLPLTIKQTRSTVMMSKIQPEMKKLQEKYKNDPQTLQQKQMALYKEMGVNPLAGCLPLLVQMPVFIAMYWVIYGYSGFNDVGFLWMKSLGEPDKTFVLPILSGLTTYLSGVMMSPKGDDPSAKTQKQMNIFMSVFFIYMSYKFKAALVLYWIISNLIQVLIQYFIINKIKHKEEAKLAE
ncbi:membrane protein insertase YidC [Fervidicella metallireducens]|uniref:membrane protein insertase YidC n=1 Tax=Fervidicella metallireducens TaxID=655338 RepID=UPI0005526C2C|nr:membrane protein insertase YidC [Fervidicella metallireducens]